MTQVPVDYPDIRPLRKYNVSFYSDFYWTLILSTPARESLNPGETLFYEMSCGYFQLRELSSAS